MLKSIINKIIPLIGTQEVKVLKTNLPEKLQSTFSRNCILNKNLHENTQIHHIKNYKVSTHSFPNQKIEEIESKCIKNGQTYRIFNYHLICSFSDYFVKFINLQFQIKSNANMYFTNKSQQSLGVHRDRYSVLILQLVGSKKWYIEGNTLTTMPGDLLYLPVGFEHYAVSLEDSYHVSFSLQLPSIFELIDQYAYSKNLKLDFNNDHILTHINQAKKIIDEFLGSPEELIKNGIKTNSHNRELRRFGSLSYHKDSSPLDLKKNYTLNFDHIISFSNEGSHLHIHNSIDSFIIKKETFKEIICEFFYLSQRSLADILINHNELNAQGLKFIKLLYNNHMIKRIYLNS